MIGGLAIIMIWGWCDGEEAEHNNMEKPLLMEEPLL